MVSSPEAQYLLIVTPATLSVSSAIKEINLPMFSPCSASGIALPIIISSINLLSRFGIELIRYFIVSAASSSGLLNLKSPFGAFPTAVR